MSASSAWILDRTASCRLHITASQGRRHPDWASFIPPPPGRGRSLRRRSRSSLSSSSEMMTLLPSLKAISTAQQTDMGYRSLGQKRQKKGREEEDSTDDTKNDSDLSLSLSLSLSHRSRLLGCSTEFTLESGRILTSPFSQRLTITEGNFEPKTPCSCKVPSVQNF